MDIVWCMNEFKNCYNKDPSKWLVDKTQFIVALRIRVFVQSSAEAFPKRKL